MSSSGVRGNHIQHCLTKIHYITISIHNSALYFKTCIHRPVLLRIHTIVHIFILHVNALGQDTHIYGIMMSSFSNVSLVVPITVFENIFAQMHNCMQLFVFYSERVLIAVSHWCLVFI